jgi:hypothetical protein
MNLLKELQSEFIKVKTILSNNISTKKKGC